MPIVQLPNVVFVYIALSSLCLLVQLIFILTRLGDDETERVPMAFILCMLFICLSTATYIMWTYTAIHTNSLPPIHPR